MVYRCYTAKKKEYAVEAESALKDIRNNLGVTAAETLTIFNRYDVEGITPEIYERAKATVFSEPPCDECWDEELPALADGAWILASEALPGQYDQRADSCAQCIQMLECSDRPAVAYARLYAFGGNIRDEEKEKIKDYLINPVDSREAAMAKPETLIAV